MGIIKGVTSYQVTDTNGNILASGMKPLTQEWFEYEGTTPQTFHEHVKALISDLLELGYKVVSVQRETMVLGLTRIALKVEKEF